MKDLQISNYLRTVDFKTMNGIEVKIESKDSDTVSIIQRCNLTGGTMANYNKEDLREYIVYLQTFHNQLK